jgi:hypothetical protein
MKRSVCVPLVKDTCHTIAHFSCGCKQLHVSETVNGVVSLKRNMNFNFLPPTAFLFFGFSQIMVLLRVALASKTYQHTFHGPTLTGVNFAFISEV